LLNSQDYYEEYKTLIDISDEYIINKIAKDIMATETAKDEGIIFIDRQAAIEALNGVYAETEIKSDNDLKVLGITKEQLIQEIIDNFSDYAIRIQWRNKIIKSIANGTFITRDNDTLAKIEELNSYKQSTDKTLDENILNLQSEIYDMYVKSLLNKASLHIY
jgi:hypothetical protein